MKLICSRGTTNYPYQVLCTITQDVVDWCEEQFGHQYDSERYRFHYNSFFFADEADRSWFVLRWS
jgi:hypothetical protein